MSYHQNILNKLFTMKANWIKKFVDLANTIAGWSKDNSTKVGAVAVNDDYRVLSIGYNGFPQGVNDNIPERKERPLKYDYTEHAERNLIYTAASEGITLRNSTIVTTLFPCPDCARGIIQSKIKRVITPKPNYNHITYGEKFKISQEMFDESGVEIIHYEN